LTKKRLKYYSPQKLKRGFIVNKIRLCLDTSFISHVDAPDTPEKMQDTLTLMKEIKEGKFEIIFSDVCFEEIDRCLEPKRQYMLDCLEEIEYKRVKINDTIKEIADHIIDLGILAESSRDDCLHIGVAIYSQCDYLVSWNFKHLVKGRTIKGVRIVTNQLGYDCIDIVSPTMLIEMEE
jgi:predicted nucleic acid-binding protein